MQNFHFNSSKNVILELSHVSTTTTMQCRCVPPSVISTWDARIIFLCAVWTFWTINDPFTLTFCIVWHALGLHTHTVRVRFAKLQINVLTNVLAMFICFFFVIICFVFFVNQQWETQHLYRNANCLNSLLIWCKTKKRKCVESNVWRKFQALVFLSHTYAYASQSQGLWQPKNVKSHARTNALKSILMRF